MSGEEHFKISQKDRSSFTRVVLARSWKEAESYVELLRDHDIPAGIDTSDGDDCGPMDGVPVLVPEDMMDEATEIVADREDLEDFRPDAEDADKEDDEEFGFVEELTPDLVGPLADEDELVYGEDGQDDEDEDEDF